MIKFTSFAALAVTAFGMQLQQHHSRGIAFPQMKLHQDDGCPTKDEAKEIFEFLDKNGDMVVEKGEAKE